MYDMSIIEDMTPDPVYDYDFDPEQGAIIDIMPLELELFYTRMADMEETK